MFDAKEYKRRYYLNNIVRLRDERKKYYRNHSDEIKNKVKKYNQTHKLERQRYDKEYRLQHARECKERGRLYRIKHITEQKEWQLINRYGITLKDYRRMYAEQEGKCSICNKWFIVLCVDHDHYTNKIRGLLCGFCNLRLSAIEDKSWNEKASEYLKRHYVDSG